MQTVNEKEFPLKSEVGALATSPLGGRGPIPVEKTTHSTLHQVDWNSLAFGKYVSDHQFICHYKAGEWQEPKIQPFQNLSLAPTALALHYGQSVFEGMKAFRMHDGAINVFRIEKHHERLNASLRRMCMPSIPYDLFAAALQQLVKVDEAWVPEGEDVALYLRPLVFASEAKFGVKISDEYIFLIITGPVSTLYQKPIRIKAERHYIRAASGGTGSAKCAGNYGGAFYATQKAKEEGFDNILWLDACSHEYVEESGTMNLLFVLDGKLVTPPVSDTILNGVTRDSLLQLAADLGIAAEERPVGISEIVEGLQSGRLTEAFGAGTAAVVAPVSTIGIDGKRYELPAYNDGNVMFRLKRALEDLRSGRTEDRFGWNSIVG